MSGKVLGMDIGSHGAIALVDEADSLSEAIRSQEKPTVFPRSVDDDGRAEAALFAVAALLRKGFP